MSVFWYYITLAGSTKGPCSEEDLCKAFADGIVNEDSVVWNGVTVSEWKSIKAVPVLSDKLIPKPEPKPASPSPQPEAPAVASGDKEERNSLLAAIRAGKKSKPQNETVEKKTVEKKPVALISLTDQMNEMMDKQDQNQPKKKSNGLTKTQPRTSMVKIVNEGAGNGKGLTITLPYNNFKDKVAYIHDAVDKLSEEDGWKILAIEKLLR